MTVSLIYFHNLWLSNIELMNPSSICDSHMCLTWIESPCKDRWIITTPCATLACASSGAVVSACATLGAHLSVRIFRRAQLSGSLHSYVPFPYSPYISIDSFVYGGNVTYLARRYVKLFFEEDGSIALRSKQNRFYAKWKCKENGVFYY